MSKKSSPVWLPIYINEENKYTFSPIRFEEYEAENNKGEKVKRTKIVDNVRAKDQYGNDYLKPMNRLARRVDAKKERKAKRERSKLVAPMV